jgi:hypothetical protein
MYCFSRTGGVILFVWRLNCGDWWVSRGSQCQWFIRFRWCARSFKLCRGAGVLLHKGQNKRESISINMRLFEQFCMFGTQPGNDKDKGNIF